MKKFYSLFAVVMLAVGVTAQTYTENFENAPSKTAYASENVNLSGVTWNITEAIIRAPGATDPDWFNGTRSLRLRGYGTTAFTMLANKAGGIGTVTFSYSRYGTDNQNTYNVDWSTDGATWTNIGAFTPSATVGTFSYNLNQPNARIRIVAANSGTSNRRANIDDIVLTDYVSLAVADFSKSGDSFIKNTLVKNEITFGADAKDVKVYSMNGQIVKSASVKANETLNVAELAKGNYIVTGTVNNKAVSQKILKN